MDDLMPCPEAALIEWLQYRITVETAALEKANSEVSAFNTRTATEGFDWSALARDWQRDADHHTERLDRWTAMLGIIRDRDEWRKQHENLLSVRQSDLAALTRTPPATQADDVGLVDLLTKAIGDISAALTMGGNDKLISKWTAPYVEAVNRADAVATNEGGTQADDGELVKLEHESVMASAALGAWLSAALDDPKVCDAMKSDINRWFSAGHLYVEEVHRREAAAFDRGVVSTFEQRARDLTAAHEAGRAAERASVVAEMQDAIAAGYPTPANKGDKCGHGRFGWEDCVECYDDALEARLDAIERGQHGSKGDE
jgi:hypothetical protein